MKYTKHHMFSHLEAKRWEKKNQTAKEKKITLWIKTRLVQQGFNSSFKKRINS